MDGKEGTPKRVPAKDKHIQDTDTRYNHAHGHGMLLYLDLAKIQYILLLRGDSSPFPFYLFTALPSNGLKWYGNSG